MDKLNLSKQKIIILAVSAVVVIGAAVAAVPLIRNLTTSEELTTEQVTTAPYTYETVTQVEYITNEDKETVTDVSGNVLTTIKKVAKTTKKVVTTKKSTGTTKKKTNTKTTKPTTSKLNKVEGVIVDNQVFGYRYNAEENYYYTDDKDCWQKGVGYNEVYDNMAPAAAMFIDQLRVRFNYGSKDWMIQFWKGQYGWLFVGAEIGVYTKPAGTSSNINHYNCADKSDWLKMEMTMYWKENNQGSYKQAFTRPYDYYWWATGFVQGRLTKYSQPRTELKVKARITFKSKEMAALFVEGLKESGFAKAPDAKSLSNDTYFRKDADVYVLWYSKAHDSVVTTTKAATEAPKPTTTQAPHTTTTTQAPATTTTTAPSTSTTAHSDTTTTTHAPATSTTTEATTSTTAAHGDSTSATNAQQ